ncbi:ABC transporter ATP-binding protein [Sorangium sp. So ce315]|uniref:ATP-binding cassette domain-containing protein n=1 Tax=Sorangium sp. So ce315 TaxID=3133299 RepID=UPI003F644875
MSASLDSASWPAARLGEAMEALARAAALPVKGAGAPAPPADLLRPEVTQPGGLPLGRWMEGAAGSLGLEAEPVEARYGDVEALIRRAGPAVLRVQGPEGRFLALVGVSRGRARLVGLDHAVIEVDVEPVRSALCSTLEAPLLPALDRVLADAGVTRRERAARAILQQQLGGIVLRGFWLLRRPPSAPLRELAAQLGLARRLAALFLAHAIEYGLWLLSWWVVGRGILAGHVDRGWLWAWGLLLLTVIPFRLLATWFSGLFAIDAATLLRQRLLAGAMQLDPNEIRRRGAGGLLGTVLEADAVESLALGGGLVSLVAVVELLMAGAVLWAGPRAGAQLAALGACVAATALLAWRYHARRRRWTRARLAMTGELVEGILGSRTRVAQEKEERWHEREDAGLSAYLAESTRLDRVQAALSALIPRGWLLLGALALAPAFISGEAQASGLAVSLGGVLLAFRAFRTLVAGITDLAGAGVAWEQVSPLQGAAAREQHASPAALLGVTGADRRGERVLLDAQQLSYAHPGRPAPVLREASLRIVHGDRLLLEGSSGAGKSTLGSILAGLRPPESGLLLLGGLDFHTLGRSGWRQRVASAPQFQDNHVLSAPFAFNLLMGRRWPPRAGDLEEAEAVCRELGLGPLLDRMPGGMLQLVGETGWQLSHGEKSRLYLARTLLQCADLVILDESFAALDPETLRGALRCALERAPTLLVIAHP